MKKPTQKDILLKLLRSTDRWFVSHELQKTETPYGWLGISADRQARDLAEAGLIERRHQGKYAEYRALPPKDVIVYRVDGVEVSRKVIWE